MMTTKLANALACGVCMVAIATPADAQTRTYNIAAGSLKSALDSYSRQSGRPIIYKADQVRGARSGGVSGAMSAEAALNEILARTSFRAQTDSSGAIAIVRLGNGQFAGDPQTVSSGAGDIGAQSAAADDERADIIVTGTNLRGQTVSASPIQVIDRTEFTRSGATSVQDVMRNVTANTGSGIGVLTNTAGVIGQHSDFNRGFASGVSLRGLGSDATLVLLNGHRLPQASQGYSADVSVIPLSAVERIDILKDGASSIYGSDAVAGVVNTVTRTDYSGLEVSANLGTVTSGGKQDYQASALWGRSWSGGNIIASYQYDNDGGLGVESRDFSKLATRPNYIIPPSIQHSGYAQINHSITPGLTFSASGLYSHRVTNADAAGLDDNNLPAESIGTSTNHTTLLTAGLSYAAFSDWTFALTGLYDEGRSTSRSQSAFFGDFFNTYRPKDYSAEFNSSGSLFSLPGGSVKVAVGGGYRQEDFSTTGDESTYSINRGITSIYGEVSAPVVGPNQNIPLVNLFNITASVRHEHYTDFGSTTNPKVGVIWMPTRQLTFRSTYSTSFRAPLLVELAQSANGVLLNFPDPFNPSQTVLSLIHVGGNPNLKPQTSRSYTAGATWKYPSSDFQVSLNYYNIHFKNLIAVPLIADIRAHPDIYASFIARNPSAAVTAPIIAEPGFFNAVGDYSPSDIQILQDIREANLSSLNTSGLDAQVSGSIHSTAGVFFAGIDLTYIISYKQAPVAGSPAVSLKNAVNNPVDLKLRAHLGWQRGPWSANAYINYTNSYMDDRDPANIAPVSSWTTVDLQMGYKSRMSVGPLAGTSFSLVVNNLFDRNPPFVQNSSDVGVASGNINYDPINASPIGRTVTLRITKSF